MVRIGILSDVHISRSVWGQRQHERLKKALLFFRDKGVDGVVICGDLQENLELERSVKNLDEFVRIWYSTFPENCNPQTGEPVEPLFIYGNHDRTVSQQGYWPEALGSFTPAWLRQVKGYWFVGANYTREADAAPLLQKARQLSEGKPFFYIQHLPLKDTLFGTDAGLLGAGGTVYEQLKTMENCIALTGHTHIPLTDERSVWQSDDPALPRITAVNCGTTNYAYIKSSNLDVNGCADDTQQGIYMTLEATKVRMERYSFYDMTLTGDPEGKATADTQRAVQLGEPWRIDVGQKEHRPYTYETGYETALAPEFPEGSRLDVGSVGATYANVLIPAATVKAAPGRSDLVQSYFVQAVDCATDQVVSTSQVAAVYHVDTAPERLSETVFLGIDGLQPGRSYLLRAYARECYQKASKPLTVRITTPG